MTTTPASTSTSTSASTPASTSASTQPTPPDPRALLWRGADQVDSLLEGLAVADLDRPTPCTQWAVRDLLAHLVAVEDRIVHIAGGGHPFEVPSQVEGVADDAWLRVWRDHRRPVEQALAADDVLGRQFHHPAGDMPGAKAVAIYANELATHGWDLARALGVDTRELDQDLAAALIGPTSQALPDGPREGFPFDRVVDVPEDAVPYDRLVAWLGRNPSWTAG